MKRKIGGVQFVLGVLVGAIVFGGTAAVAAAGIMAQQKTAAVVIDGKTVDLKGYLIEGAHYFQLRDLSEQLKQGGKDFSVVWDSEGNRVLIDTSRGYDPNEQYAPPATAAPQPTQTPAPTPASTIPIDRTDVPEGILDKDLAIWLDENYQPYENEYEAIRLINAERENAGLEPVTLNLELCKVARIKAIEMVELNYLAHESPNYGAHTEMVEKFGIKCVKAAENAAYLGGSSAKGVVWNWMHSEGHKKNILNPKHKEIGIGFTDDGTGLGYWSLFLMY